MRYPRRLLAGAPVLVLAGAVVACGDGGSTTEFCEGWQASIDQLAVVAEMDEADPSYPVEVQLLQDLNTAVYDLAPADIREAAQQLANLRDQRTPEELLELSEQTDALTNTILAYVDESCPD